MLYVVCSSGLNILIRSFIFFLFVFLPLFYLQSFLSMHHIPGLLLLRCDPNVSATFLLRFSGIFSSSQAMLALLLLSLSLAFFSTTILLLHLVSFLFPLFGPCFTSVQEDEPYACFVISFSCWTSHLIFNKDVLARYPML